MRAGPSRRDVARWMLSAPVGGLLSSRLVAGPVNAYGAGFQAALEAARRRIEREIAGGGAIGVALAYPPASVYEYSNIGYAALNAIASSLTRTEFGALMRERVPSGATRYDSLGRAIAHSVTSTPASGELYASAHDLA